MASDADGRAADFAQESPNKPMYRMERFRKQHKRHELLRWMMSVLVGAAMVLFLFLVWLSPLIIKSDSMSPTLRSGETVMYSRISKFLSIPERSNIVVFRHPLTREVLIKRIIALPGESVTITDGAVCIDGRYILSETDYVVNANYDMDTTVVPDGCVFVLSDDRLYGNDSRDESIGCIPYAYIMGTVRIRLNRPCFFSFG